MANLCKVITVCIISMLLFGTVVSQPIDYTNQRRSLSINKSLPIYSEVTLIERDRVINNGWSKESIELIFDSTIDDVKVLSNYLEKNYNMHINYGEQNTTKEYIDSFGYNNWNYIDETKADYLYEELFGVYQAVNYLPEWVFKKYSTRYGTLAINLFYPSLEINESTTVGAFTLTFSYRDTGKLHHIEFYTKMRDVNGVHSVHEFTHIAERVMQDTAQKKYKQFKREYEKLNPYGFSYGIVQTLPKEERDKYFATGYSVVSFSEDVATLMEQIYLYDTQGKEYNPALQAKVDLIRKYLLSNS